MAARRQQARRLEADSAGMGSGLDQSRFARRAGVVLGIAVVVALLVWATRVLLDPATLPITTIRVEGSFHHVSAEQLRAQVAGALHGGFFDVNVDALQQRIEQLPWVAHATVRRIWPGTVAINVDEQQALARWAAGGLINRQGQLFKPQPASYPAGLPELAGPPGSEAQLSERYRAVQDMLQPLGLKVSELEQDARRAWSLRLDNGIELVLGREDSMVRLTRFTEVWPRVLANREQTIARVDLRYTNGFAVLWKPAAQTGQG